jgi:hypothetical protein
MNVECLGAKIEVPDYLVQTYIKDFEGLPGSGNRESVLELRHNVNEVIDYVSQDPEALHEYAIRNDFINALAVQKALEVHGLLLDS